MNSQLDNLYSGQVASTDIGVLGQRHLRETNGAGVGAVGRTKDLECGNHGIRHVDGAVIGAISAKAQVDEGKGLFVAAKPAWLESDSAAGRGPVGAIICSSNATA